MIRIRPLFLLAASLLFLSGCNMPLPGSAREPTPADLRGQVSVPTEFRAGPGDVYDLLGELLPGGSSMWWASVRRERTCSSKTRPTRR